MKTDECRKRIIETVEELGRKHDRSEVWRDFVTMYSCAISNLFDKRFYDQREKTYMNIAGKYSERELLQFADIASFIIIALEINPEQDFLGSIYSELNLCNKHIGQVLTPYNIGCLVCSLESEDLNDLIKEKHVISVADFCCGPGCLLIAFANEARRKINY